MSDFYAKIAKYYDYIFPTGKAQADLIKELAGPPPKDILDAACGSGGYAQTLRNEGYNITAIDLSKKMVDKLKGKDSSIDARVLNMLEVEKLDKQFDLIFCIGNSIVHLDNNDEIYTFLEGCKKSLKPYGKLLLQVVNYDRVLAKNIKSLPPIQNHKVNLIFERYYKYVEESHKVNFKTILKVDGQKLENNVLLHPVKSAELTSFLEQLGFINIHLYGSFKKDPFCPMESFPLIVWTQA